VLMESVVPLTERHDVFMFDLDGVIYVGAQAVPGVAEHIAALRARGVRTAFVTNNASRSTVVVAEHLTALGIACPPEDVVNSAQAAASLLAAKHPVGSKVLVLGGGGLTAALVEVGLVPVTETGEREVVELLTGFGPDVVWRDIMQAAARVRTGLPWTASNTDTTFPTEDGPLPGHGLLVELITKFSGVVPEVAGKPERPLLDATVERTGAVRPLMVGDRLDTDIEGGHNAGVGTLLVLTGVSGLDDLVTAAPHRRPHFICPTLAEVFEPQPVPVLVEGAWNLDGWNASVVDGVLEVTGDGKVADWWRVVAVTAWEHLDATGHPVSVHNAVPPLPR
jgi:glycerol-1-phosphatase